MVEGCAAYFHVKAQPGAEPGSEEYVWSSAIQKHVTVYIPSRETGMFLFGAFIFSMLLFLVVILMNFLTNRFFKKTPSTGKRL